MSVRSMLPRAVVTGAALASVLLPQAAHAVPLYVVTGTGYLAPGLSAPVSPPQSFWFTGTGTTGLATHPCSFSGTSLVGGPNSLSGTMSGWCGPTTYPSCVFTLTLTTWDFVCVNGSVGTFAVQPADINPMTAFTASGTIS